MATLKAEMQISKITGEYRIVNAAAAKVHAIGKAICRATTQDCVMDTDPDREKCHTGNCRMMRIAEGALMQASHEN